jgi:hypothetical protein
MKAYEFLKNHGWSFCMMGAMHQAYRNDPAEAYSAARKLSLLLDQGAIAFNDTPSRTKEEVLAVLKEAGV